MTNDRSMRVRDDHQVREVFSNQVLGTMFDGSTIQVTFGVVRTLPEKTGDKADLPAPHVAVSGRLALTPKAAAELVQGLTKMLGMMNSPLVNEPADKSQPN